MAEVFNSEVAGPWIAQDIQIAIPERLSTTAVQAILIVYIGPPGCRHYMAGWEAL